MKISFLGTSSAVATAKRDNTSLLFCSKKRSLLVDCPGSIYHKLLKAGMDPRNLDMVFITHTHPDHIYGLASLIHSLSPAGKFPDIYVPPESIDKIRAFLGLFNLGCRASLKEARDSLPFCDTRLFHTRHTPDSRGLIIKEEKKKIIYTSDTGPLDEKDNSLYGSHCLIHDCLGPEKFKNHFPGVNITHTGAETLGEIASKSKTQILIPVHFSGERGFSFDEIKSDIRKNYKGKLIIPRDYQSIEV
ncbi:MAG: MBL fold metallo-hydrolase [Elusimicrobiota bacterium]